MTEEKIQELHERVMLRARTQEPYDSRLSVCMSPEEYTRYHTNFGHTYYLYLKTIVRELAPRKVLELGTDIGRSTLFMMLALPKDSSLITVELHDKPRCDLSPFFDDPRLTIVQGDDLDLSIYKERDLSGIDLLYIDTNHDFDQISKEWELYRQFLAKDAIVILDDIHLNAGMDRFWESLSYPKVDGSRTIHFSGWGIFAYPGDASPLEGEKISEAARR
jgi:predicted O-methyltransferase YrrM